MIYKSSNAAFTGCINNLLCVYSEKVTSTLILQPLSRVILCLTLVCNSESYYLSNILNNLRKNDQINHFFVKLCTLKIHHLSE